MNVCDNDSVCVSDLVCVNECVADCVGSVKDVEMLLLTEYERVTDGVDVAL